MVSTLALMLGACGRAEPPEGSSTEAPSSSGKLSDQEISDAYIYLMSRLLVTRQQQIDFDKEGLAWNQLTHRKSGGVDWPNPNLDVAYSEAWVAVDETTCTLVTVPKITGRYYTVHFLNGWGETVANINERVFPDHPSGEFAVYLKGASVAIPEGAVRVDLPVKYTRVLARVELGSNWDEAVALQHQFQMKPIGSPNLPEIPKTLLFDGWPGVEAFDSAELALDSEADINPGMETVQANARAVARAVKDPAERARVDAIIKDRAMADLAKAGPVMGHGTMKNGWATPSTSGVYGEDWLTRTLVNFGGIWANVRRTSFTTGATSISTELSYIATTPIGSPSPPTIFLPSTRSTSGR